MTTFPDVLCELIGGAERYDQGDGFDVEIIKIKNKDHNNSLEKPLNRLTLANLCKQSGRESINNVSATPPFNLLAPLVGLLGTTCPRGEVAISFCLTRHQRRCGGEIARPRSFADSACRCVEAHLACPLPFTPGSVARARADVLTGGVPLEVYAFSNGDVVRPLVPKLCARSC